MRLSSSARERFWLLPLLCAAAAVGLGLGTIALDELIRESVRLPFLITSGVDGARGMLAAIAGSMISFTGLVFSITIVTLQLTSGQFSPRVLRTFLRDRFNQLTLGVFVATFVYAMVVLRSVRADPEFVPQIGVSVAFLLVLTSVVVFLLYLHHIAQSIRVAQIIASIGAETRDLIERHCPLDVAEPDDTHQPGNDRQPGPSRIVAARRTGVITGIDDAKLARLAQRSDSVVELLRAVGEFVPAGAALLRVHGTDPPTDRQLCDEIDVGEERTLDQDVGFGLRQLVDIAERALSPGVNDPTTAVQVVDQLHDLLRRLVARPLPPRRRTTDAGRPAVVIPAPDIDSYLVLAVDEIARWGADADRVQNRLRAMLRDLHGAALPAHRAAIARQLQRWDERPPQAGVPDLTPSDVGLRPSAAWDTEPADADQADSVAAGSGTSTTGHRA